MQINVCNMYMHAFIIYMLVCSYLHIRTYVCKYIGILLLRICICIRNRYIWCILELSVASIILN